MNKSDVSENDFSKEDEDELASKYVPPKNVPISEIWNKDVEDPSLTKYKQQLIGGAINVIIGTIIIYFSIFERIRIFIFYSFLEPSDPSKLLLKSLVLVPDDHGELVFDLKGNLDRYKDHVVTLKEGAIYRIKLDFYVQRDIVSGLKLVQAAYKGPIRSRNFKNNYYFCLKNN